MKNLPTTARLKGTRTETAHGGNAKVWLDGKLLNLQASLKYCSKSPTGFNWGYGGSGPAQLAHEICRQLYGLETANLVFQDFKWTFISSIQGDSFDMVLDLKVFNNAHGLGEDLTGTDDDDDLYDDDNGPTGHGDVCWSDTDVGL
jgi:hypothetical protein